MPFYFENFPTVNYDIKKNNNFNLLTNITLRYKIQSKLKDKRQPVLQSRKPKSNI